MLVIPDYKNRILVFILLLSFTLMSLGTPILGEGGKLSFSNLMQVMAVGALILLGKITLGDIFALSLFFILICSSILNVFVSYGFTGKPFVALFMIISVLFSRASERFILENYKFRQFAKAMKFLLLVAIPIYLGLGLLDYIKGNIQVSYGMDDKSHAAIILCFLSFLSLIFIKRFWIILAFTFYFLSLFTISRLPVIFFPFLLISVLIRLKDDKGVAFTILLSFLVLVPILSYIIYILFQNSETFLLMQRVSSGDAMGDDSSMAHKLLLIKGVELKCSSWNNFLFGVSPGAFSDILIRSTLNYSQIEALDPQFIEFAKLGKAPIHSTHVSVFCEYPIIVFIFYLVLIGKVTLGLAKEKLFIDLLFWIGFLMSITFYSCHNKFYFYIIFVYMALRIRYSEKNNLFTDG